MVFLPRKKEPTPDMEMGQVNNGGQQAARPQTMSGIDEALWIAGATWQYEEDESEDEDSENDDILDLIQPQPDNYVMSHSEQMPSERSTDYHDILQRGRGAVAPLAEGDSIVTVDDFDSTAGDNIPYSPLGYDDGFKSHATSERDISREDSYRDPHRISEKMQETMVQIIQTEDKLNKLKENNETNTNVAEPGDSTRETLINQESAEVTAERENLESKLAELKLRMLTLEAVMKPPDSRLSPLGQGYMDPDYRKGYDEKEEEGEWHIEHFEYREYEPYKREEQERDEWPVSPELEPQVVKPETPVSGRRPPISVTPPMFQPREEESEDLGQLTKKIGKFRRTRKQKRSQGSNHEPGVVPPPDQANVVGTLPPTSDDRTDGPTPRIRAELEGDPKIQKIVDKLSKNPLVIEAQNEYTTKEGDFINKLFESVEKGELTNVQAKVAVLDIQGKDEHDLEKVVNKGGYPLLQVALLVRKNDIVHYLVSHSGDQLTDATFIRDEYSLTPLHLALFQGNPETIKLILDSIPKKDQKHRYVNTKFSIDLDKGKPYGELPLAAGVWSCMNNRNEEESKQMEDIKKILHYLMRSGANLDEETENEGNTLLHLIVLQAAACPTALSFFKKFLTDVFQPEADRWWRKRSTQNRLFPNGQNAPNYKTNPAVLYLLRKTNKAGLTPLTLAAYEESPLYVHLVQWKHVLCIPAATGSQFAQKFYYNITDIASIGEDGAYRDMSVMNVLAHNSIDLCSSRISKTDIVDTEPLKTLIKHKWDYYWKFFYLWGLFHIVYMTVFTNFSLQDLAHIPTGSSNSTNETLTNQTDIKTKTEREGKLYFMTFLIVPVIYLLIEVIDVCTQRKSLRMSYTITGNFLYRTISVVFAIFTLIWFPLHMIGNVNQDILLALSLLFGWIFCIFFTRTIGLPSKESQIGAFSIMVQRMLFHDLMPFLLISFFVIISFTTAMQATLSFINPPKNADLTFRHTFYQMLKYFASLDDPMNEEASRAQQFAKALLVMYGIIIAVLLLNMLIAAMNKSYDIIRETRCNLVGRQRLAILLLLERRLPFWRQTYEYNDDGQIYIKISHTSIVGHMLNDNLRRFRKKEKQA